MLFILTKEELDALKKEANPREDITDEVRKEWIQAITKFLIKRPIRLDWGEDPRPALGKWLKEACDFAESEINPEPPDNIIPLSPPK